VPWIFFSTCLSGGCNCILASSTMVTKIYFPREVLPLSFVLSAFVNMLYCFIVIFAVILFSGLGFNIVALLYLPIVFVVELFLCIGITLLFSSLTVYVRDLAHIMGILTMLLQFLTPVMYPVSRIAGNKKITPFMLHLYMMNPMANILECYRNILYNRQIPDISTLASAVAFGVLFLVVGECCFMKLQKGFAEEL
ncbi:MAG: ABC transporter permease, partial [Treponema sp.]|nr:ABC transporter permease [Treponema sp.]